MNWITKEDWEAWLSRLRLYLLEESHSPSLRACYDAAVKVDTLAKDLFNVAFICWWNEVRQSSFLRLRVHVCACACAVVHVRVRVRWCANKADIHRLGQKSSMGSSAITW
jgi:hypothetical protein